MRVKILVLFAVVAATVGASSFVGQTADASPTDTATHFRLVIVAGQSNAVGFAGSLDLYPDIAENANVDYSYYLEGATWGPAASTSLQALARVGQFWGSEMRIAQRLSANRCAGERVVMVKVTRGASTLHSDWARGTTMYQTLVNRTQQAISAVAPPGSQNTLSLDGLYLALGGTDINSPYAANYQTNLENFIADLRSDLGDSALPVVVQRTDVPTTNDAGPSFDPVGKALVTAAQMQVASDDPDVVWTDSSDASRGADGVHFDGAGLNLMGNRAGYHLLDMRDADGDGVSDMQEIRRGTDPCASTDLAVTVTDQPHTPPGSATLHNEYSLVVSNIGSTGVSSFLVQSVVDGCQAIETPLSVDGNAGTLAGTGNPSILRWTGALEPGATVNLVLRTKVQCVNVATIGNYSGIYHPDDEVNVNNMRFTFTDL